MNGSERTEAPGEGTARQPNILFIVADQWRGDTVAALGHACVSTPNLDRLVREGTAFTRHFSQASPCGPARASMLTGRYLFNHHQVGNWTPLSAGHETLGTYLRKRGYRCALIGYTDTPFDPTAMRPKPDLSLIHI